MPDWGNITLTALITAALNGLLLYFWKPWVNAYAGERGKNLARKADLDLILAEVRDVTETQKQIETKLSGDLWDRQNQWNHKRDTYARLLEAGQKIQDAANGLLALLPHRIAGDATTSAYATELVNKRLNELNSAHSELMHATSLAAIFACPECHELLREFMNARAKLQCRLEDSQWVQSEIQLTVTLLGRLPSIAKKDLGLNISSWPMR